MYNIILEGNLITPVTFKTKIRALSALKSIDAEYSKKPYEIIEYIDEDNLVNCFRCDIKESSDNMLNTDIGYLCECCEGDLR